MISDKQRRDEAEMTAFYMSCGMSLPVIRAAIEIRRGNPVKRPRLLHLGKRKKRPEWSTAKVASIGDEG